MNGNLLVLCMPGESGIMNSDYIKTYLSMNRYDMLASSCKCQNVTSIKQFCGVLISLFSGSHESLQQQKFLTTNMMLSCMQE